MRFDQEIGKEPIHSWGRQRPSNSKVRRPASIREIGALNADKYLLPRGQGRSYGDCCLNDGGTLIDTRWLDKFIAFDQENGILKCEAGVTLRQILNFAVPRGWFPEVTPGTKWVSVGGAIANDVHGKNHHISGTFGGSVSEIELLRSDGSSITCSHHSNSELFKASIAGLGLTGLILSATIKLKRVHSAMIECENHPFRDVDHYLELTSGLSKRFTYTVAWIDCADKKSSSTRGILMCGNHAPPDGKKIKTEKKPLLAIPQKFPSFLLSNFTAARFNDLFHFAKSRKRGMFLAHYDPFFYPLDRVSHWNNLYGNDGFFQFQCVVPPHKDGSLIQQLLEIVRQSPLASYLAVLKDFGELASPGMISFPRAGHTICFDIPNRGEEGVRLIQKLNQRAVELGGAIYPAKDALMEPSHFAASFPRLREFASHRDPAFSSDLWRRVTAGIDLGREQR